MILLKNIIIPLLIVILGLCFIIITYSEQFVVDIPSVNFFDMNTSKNQKIFDNNYTSVIAEAYNKLILSDEDQIKKIYDDTIIKSNVSSDLLKGYNKLKNVSNNLPVNANIKTIKSKNNAQHISVTNNDKNNYRIHVNDKCVTVSGICPDSPYCLTDCQNKLYVSDSQKFYNTRIATESDAMKIMGSDFEISPNNVYPFNIFRSKVDDTCLSMSNEGLTLEQCNLNNIKHQWNISPNENICVLN